MKDKNTNKEINQERDRDKGTTVHNLTEIHICDPFYQNEMPLCKTQNGDVFFFFFLKILVRVILFDFEIFAKS